MTTERFANQASTILSSAVGFGDLSIIVQSTTHFPTFPEFRVRIGQELLLVTEVVGTTWTVTRGIEGTSAASHAVGTAVVAVLTGGALDEMRAEIEGEHLTAGSLATTTTSVVVSGATAPSAGQALVATSGTAAAWGKPSDATAADGLTTTTTTVAVSGAIAPSAGQALVATGATAAAWGTPAIANGLASATTNISVSSATAPTAGQVLTATSGTAGSWHDPVPIPVTITTSTGCNPGDVVRISTAGTIVPAQADSTSHASAVVGKWDGTQVIPFSAQPIVTFDSAPVVEQPCYVSATTAGALTSVYPGSLATPANLMVLEDKSVGAFYAARVGINYATVQVDSLEARIKSDAARLTGISPGSMRVFFDDFNSLPTSGTPTWGRTTAALGTPTRASTILGNNGALIAHDLVLPNSQLTLQRWYFEVRFQNAYVSNAGVIIVLIRVNGGNLSAGCETIGVGTISTTSYAYYTGGGDLENYPGTLGSAIAPLDFGVWHTYKAWCSVDNQLSQQFDSLTVDTHAYGAQSATLAPSIKLGGWLPMIDYVAFCSVLT